ncbi:MAG: DUF2490 domain-containing protein, partial [Candidatus Omnitrophota bacterium]
MKKIAAITISSIICFYNSFNAFALEDGDWQLWNTDGIEWKATKKVKLKIAEELRFGDDMSRLYYYHTEGGFDLKLFDWFTFGADYRQVWQKTGNKWKQEDRPQINGTFNWDFKGFKIQDRNRLEYRIRKWTRDDWRYRNKLALLVPLKFEKFEIEPYVADEIFINFGSDKRIARNRL